MLNIYVKNQLLLNSNLIPAARMAAHSGTAPFPNIGSNPSMMPPISSPIVNTLHPVQQAGNIAQNAHFDPMNFNAKGADGKDEEITEAKSEKKKKQDAERKKKEEEDKAKQQAAKQQDKSRPISSTPIAGTPWCVVWTGDGRVFFYNPSTRTSVWERPDDLIGRPDVDKAVSTAPDQLTQSAATKDEKPKTLHTEIIIEKFVISSKRSESESSGENDEIPQKKMKTSDSIGKLLFGYSI